MSGFFGSGFFGGGSGSSVPVVPPATAFSPVGDFALVTDGLETVTLTQRDGTETELTYALKRAVNRKEMLASNGRYRTTDLVWNLSIPEQAERPDEGAWITPADGTHYTVLETSRATLGDRWRCVTRNLTVAENLRTLIRIEQANHGKTPAGAWEETWDLVEADVLACIQPVSADRMEDQDRVSMPERAQCVFQTMRKIDVSMRIVDDEGTAWRIVRVTNKDRIESLLMAEVEKTPWPFA